ncbi:MAG: ferrochelatase [Pirellulaceae bacterium]|nr:ferrochelatase [Pirellulaceae bacterium]
MSYDSILLVSFGGPEGPDDVMPFLENVLRGKNVPRERLLEVAGHYQSFGGISPINGQCRALIRALRAELDAHEILLPIYWGNRNWEPMLEDTLRQMMADGKQHALAFFTSMFSCYSGCRQYRENVHAAQIKVGPGAPSVDKLRMAYNHPGFIEPQAELLQMMLAKVAPERCASTPVLFCAHSIPMSMAENSRYQQQLLEACRLVAERAGHTRWELVFQSRSGSPQQPWLAPDVCDRIEQLHEAENLSDVVLHPIGFISDHMEVIYDLDDEAAKLCEENQIRFYRVPTVGTHPRFVSMIRELIVERLSPGAPKSALGQYGPNHDLCPENCCLYPQTARPAR